MKCLYKIIERIHCLLEIKVNLKHTAKTKATPMHKNTVTNRRAFLQLLSRTICAARAVFEFLEQLSKIAGSQLPRRHMKQKAYSEIFRICSATVSIQIRNYHFSSCVDMCTRSCFTQFLKSRDLGAGNALIMF